MRCLERTRFRRAGRLALAGCAIGFAVPAVAQSAVPPGYWGRGWGDYPYWLVYTFDDSYESHAYPETRPVCLKQKQLVYSRKYPTQVVGSRTVYVCQ